VLPLTRPKPSLMPSSLTSSTTLRRRQIADNGEVCPPLTDVTIEATRTRITVTADGCQLALTQGRGIAPAEPTSAAALC